jgi:hypothetical protein
LHGPVVYVLGEGVAGWKYRLKAWEHTYGELATDRLWTRPSAIQLVNADEVRGFIADVSELPEPPKLIVFDTLSRCLAGVEENSSKEMTLAMRHLDEIMEQLDCSVLFLHHTRKDGLVERGHSAIRGALDHQFFLTSKGKGSVKFSTDKAKDTAASDEKLLVADVVHMPDIHQQTGKQWTSLVVRPATVVETVVATQDDPKDRELLERALDCFRENPAPSRDALAKAIGGKGGDAQKDRRLGRCGPDPPTEDRQECPSEP